MSDEPRDGTGQPAGPTAFFERRRGRVAVRRGVGVQPEGLVEGFRRGRTVTPWTEVYGVERHDSYAVIRLAGRAVRIDDRFGDWRRLADLVEGYSPAVRGDLRGREVAPEQIAEWLGIPVDGVLFCRLKMGRGCGWALLALGLLMLIGCFAGGSSGAVGGLTQVVVIGLAVLFSADQIRADVHGLTCREKGRPQRYAWSEIERVDRSGSNGLVVHTTRGKFTIASAVGNFAALARCLDHVTGARGAGAVLPSEAPMPEGALSRLTGDVEPADRAISIVRPGDDG